MKIWQPLSPPSADRHHPVCALLATLFAPLALCPPAWAAGPSGEAELRSIEVVGSTPIDSIGLPLDQVPTNVQTLAAPPRDGVSHLGDVLNEHLGAVSVSNASGNPYQSDVNYRGFQATSQLGAPVGLSLYWDGVRMNTPFGSNIFWDLIPINAVAGVDVLPGANPMFGLNTLGGALLARSKNGTDDPGSTVSALAGSFRRKALRFEVGGADPVQGTDYFLAGNWDHQAGYRSHSDSDVRQLFGKTRWQGHGGRSRLELSATLANTSLRGTQALPLDMMDHRSSAYTWPDSHSNQLFLVNAQGSHWLSDAQQLSGNLFLRQGNSLGVNSNAALDDGCLNEDGSLVLSGGRPKCAGKAPNGTAINSVTSPSALALGYGRWTSSINTSVVQSQTREMGWGGGLQWTDLRPWQGHDNTLVLGGAWDSTRIRYDQSTLLARLIDYQTVLSPHQTYGFTANGLPPSASNPLSFNGSPLLSSVDLASTQNNVSVYLSESLKYSERLSLSASGSFNVSTLHQSGANRQYLNDDGGFQWTDSSSGISYYNPGYSGAYQYSNTSSNGAKPGPNGIPAGAVAGPETHDLNGRHHYQRFNPAFGFNYQLAPHQGLYGHYSEAMRAPTSIELSCADPHSPCALPTGFNGDPDLKAVVAKSVELGARGRLGERGSWSAAVFDTRLSHDIQFIATSSSQGYFANVGATERRGLELSAQDQHKSLSWAASYGWVDARYRSAFTTASGQQVESGNTLPGIARQTLKLRASLKLNPDLVLGSQWILAGPQYTHGNESNQTPGGQVAGYGVLNLDAHWQLSPGLQLHVNLNNALDKRYATYGMSGLRSVYTLASQTFLTPAAPRALWLNLSYHLDGGAPRGTR